MTTPATKPVLVSTMWEAFVDAVRARSPRAGDTSATMPAWTNVRTASPPLWLSGALASGTLVYRPTVADPWVATPQTDEPVVTRALADAAALDLDPATVVAAYQSGTGRAVFLAVENERFATVTKSFASCAKWRRSRHPKVPL